MTIVLLQVINQIIWFARPEDISLLETDAVANTPTNSKNNEIDFYICFQVVNAIGEDVF